ncbi:hypothetical protein ACEPAI_5018 [Sanghuangporus weigelae]
MAPARARNAGFNASSDVRTGSKRKRIGSANENGQIHTRSSRAMGKFKRQRSLNDSSEEEVSSQTTMEVDDADKKSQDWSSDLSDEEDALLDDSDEYLLNRADYRELNRLRKDELVHLYSLSGLTASAEELTKSDIINSIISARTDDEEVPPSSPPGKTEDGYSSDDGHDGGGEETDAVRPLRRRSTVQEISRTVKRTAIALGRSLSLGQSNKAFGTVQQKKCARISEDVRSPIHRDYINGTSRRRRTQSYCSSPQVSFVSYSLPSPPATRLRSRTISAESKESSSQTSSHATSSAGSSGRTKRKHSGSRSSPAGADMLVASKRNGISEPSPRRLRSRQLDSASSQDSVIDAEGPKKRFIPMRKAKRRIGSLKEDSTTAESDDEEPDNGEEEEVDELDSSPSPLGSPEPRQNRLKEQRTPMKRRLRPRKLQMHTPPSDGDDEDDEDDEDEEDEEDAGDNGGEDESEDTASAEGAEEKDGEGEEDDEDEPVVEPRVLRNGKIVGEDVVQKDTEESEDGTENSGSEIDVDQESDGDEAIEVEEGFDEDEDEMMEDEFDISSATQKTLVRLRRDDLIRLCEARDLDAEGTKPQLAKTLLEWRDSQDSVTTCPSSSSTARPPSVTRMNGRRRRTRSKSKSSSATPPVLMRSHRIHEDEPVTPPLSKDKKDDGELELDLETLGLEDREIPPDKLTKLEKIGSGGFKDVYIGKFRGRKVAISEFRDQLSPMDIKELKLLAEFKHPNIVRFLGVSIPENTRETPAMIVSELCSNGDLFDYIRNVPAPPLHKVLSLMLDIARGLEYLHTRKPSVIHRDCKSSNILITSKGTAKIADFGLAKVKQSTRSMVRSLVGTVNWQAPELWVAHPKYNHKVDVFSCACVYWETLQWHNPNKKFPWEGMNEHAIYEAVGQKRQRPSLSGLRKLWCPDIVELIDRMWAQDPQDRPTITEVVEELQRIIKEYR